jgi:hypothetical protein
MVNIKTEEDKLISSSDYWGPHAWYLLHHITRHMVKNNPLLNNDDEILNNIYKDAMSEYFTTLLLLMPCGICQKNFVDKLDEHHYIDVIDNWKKIDLWGFKLHNSVNKMLEKKQFSYVKYIKQYSRSNLNHKKLLQYPIILQKFHVKPEISISEIQTMKRYLEAIMIVYPQKLLTIDDIKNKRKEIQAIFDYNSLNKYYDNWLKNKLKTT